MKVWIVTQSVTDFLSEGVIERILGVFKSDKSALDFATKVDYSFEEDKKIVESLKSPYELYSSSMYNALDAIWEDNNEEQENAIREEYNTKMFEHTGYTISDYEDLKNSVELCTPMPCEIKCFEVQ